MTEAQGVAVEVTRRNKLAAQLQKLVMGAVSNGVGPVTGSVDYAHARLRAAGIEPSLEQSDGSFVPASASGSSEVDKVIQRIIRESVAAAGTSGFVTGLGGLIAMPVTLPANLAGSMVINARMVGAVAYLRGYSLDDPHTQAMLMMVVAGSSAQAALSAFGVKVGKEVTKQAIKAVSVETIRAINKKAGFYLVAKYGSKRATVTLAKAVPGVGGLVGGVVDATLTRSVGSVAKRVFPAQ